ncbi:MAG: hypothetical protein ACKVQA_11835 [Burkholderiales bacterium]
MPPAALKPGDVVIYGGLSMVFVRRVLPGAAAYHFFLEVIHRVAVDVKWDVAPERVARDGTILAFFLKHGKTRVMHPALI